MISIFVKRTEDVDLATPLYNYIRENYSKQEADDVKENINAFNDARKRIVRMNQDREIAVKDYIAYYLALQEMTQRFPFGKHDGGGIFSRHKHKTVMCTYSWFDAYRASKNVREFDVRFEKHCVLFNIGALYSLQAVKFDRSDADGLKAANKLFMASAGVFRYLSENHGEISSLPYSVDLSQDSLNMLASLMLAQAQACFFEGAAKKKVSAGLVGKLAMATSEFFEDAYKAIMKSELLVNWLRKGDYGFAEHCKFQAECFHAASQYWEAKKVLADDEYGIEITRLQLAKMYLGRAKKLSKENIVPALESSRSKLYDMTVQRLKEATKDNDAIYHYRIPKGSELDVIVPRATVKPAPLDFPQNSENKTDAFDNLVPVKIKESGDALNSQLRNEIGVFCTNATQSVEAARAHLGTMNLPAALDALDPDMGIPGDVWERVQDVQRKGGAQGLNDQIERVQTASKEAWGMYSEVTKMLEEEAKNDTEYRQEFGSRWNIVPSDQITSKYKRDADIVHGYLNQAFISNSKIETEWQDVQPKVKDFGLSRDEISARIPKPPDNINKSESAENLKINLDELANMLQEREERIEELKKDADNENFVRSLMANKNTHTPEQTYEEVRSSKYDPLKLAITDNMTKQEPLLETITNNNKEFVASRDNSEQMKARSDVIHELNSAAETYNKLLNNLNEGMTFYSNIRKDYIEPLKQTVADFILARDTEAQAKIRALGGRGGPGAAAAAAAGGGVGAAMGGMSLDDKPPGSGFPSLGPGGGSQGPPGAISAPGHPGGAPGAPLAQPQGQSPGGGMGPGYPYSPIFQQGSPSGMPPQQQRPVGGMPPQQGGPGMPPQGGPGMGMPQPGPATQEPPRSPDTWACTYCTFANPISDRICQMCAKTKADNPQPFSQPVPQQQQQYQQPPQYGYQPQYQGYQPPPGGYQPYGGNPQPQNPSYQPPPGSNQYPGQR